MADQKLLDEFIERAGFSYGWDNLESWARRMAERAVEELAAKQAQPVLSEEKPIANRHLCNRIAQLEPVVSRDEFAGWTRAQQDAYCSGFYACRFIARGVASDAVGNAAIATHPQPAANLTAEEVHAMLHDVAAKVGMRVKVRTIVGSGDLNRKSMYCLLLPESAPTAAADGAELTFWQIEDAFPEGGSMQADGRKLVGAEWLHQFAKNIASLCRGHAVAPLPLASSTSVRDDAEFWQLLRENAEVVYGVRRTTKDTSAAIVAFVDKRIAEARQQGCSEGAIAAGKEMGRFLVANCNSGFDATPAAGVPPAVRRFVHTTGFQNGAAYVEFKNGAAGKVMAPDGTWMRGDVVHLEAAELFVRRGVWREVTVTSADGRSA